MVNLIEAFKYILDDDEKEIQFEASDVFKAIVVEGINGSKVRIEEGDSISFQTENGEVREGTVLKFLGGNKEKKIQFLPSNSDCEETWSLFKIQEGSLKVVNKEGND